MTTKTTRVYLDASAAVEALPALLRSLQHAHDTIINAAHSARDDWTGLKRVGGARDDHAAALLHPLAVRMALLRDFAARTHDQLHAVICDPFGDDA